MGILRLISISYSYCFEVFIFDPVLLRQGTNCLTLKFFALIFSGTLSVVTSTCPQGAPQIDPHCPLSGYNLLSYSQLESSIQS